MINTSYSGQFTLFQLETPINRFHSHHWFHICEYYLTQPLSSQRFQFIGNNHNYIIIPPTSKFFIQLTKTAFFFLLLSLPIQSYNKALNVIVIDPTYVTRKSINTTSSTYYINLSADLRASLWIYNSNNLFGVFRKVNNVLYSDYVTSYSPDAITIPGRLPVPATDWFRFHNESDVIRDRIVYYCTPARAILSSPTSSSHSTIETWRSEHSQQQIHTSFNRSSRSSKDRFISTKQLEKASPSTLKDGSSTTPMNATRTLKLVVYQRDSNRRIFDLHTYLHDLFIEVSSIRHTALHDQVTSRSHHSHNHSNPFTTSPSTSSSSSLSETSRGLSKDPPQAHKHASRHKLSVILTYVWEVRIIHHREDADPCLLYHTLRDADILLTTHGFQSMGKLSSHTHVPTLYSTSYPLHRLIISAIFVVCVGYAHIYRPALPSSRGAVVRAVPVPVLQANLHTPSALIRYPYASILLMLYASLTRYRLCCVL